MYNYLHSTMFLLIRSSGLDVPGHLHEFTFHYVSTYTNIRVFTLHCGTIFTFHYVSTYTRRNPLLSAPFLHLHSTMFLLIPLRQVLIVAHNLIYIPLCFYLYEEEATLTSGIITIYIPLCFYLY